MALPLTDDNEDIARQAGYESDDSGFADATVHTESARSSVSYRAPTELVTIQAATMQGTSCE
jgi:hypothetical protein